MNMYRYISLSCLLVMSIAGVEQDTSPIYLFAHGILDTGQQIHNYIPKIISHPFVTFNFSDACYPVWGIKLCKFWHCSFGQDNDIATLARAYNLTREKYSDRDIVLVGLSRGASVAWSFAALHQPTHVKALILESPFDRVQNALDAALDHIPDLIQSIPGTRTLAAWVLRYLAYKYNPGALQPIDLVERMPKHLPILIICSLGDKLVPAESSLQLYKKLKAAGHQHVHILVVPAGKHSRIIQSSHGYLYESAVHAFYKKYGLKYDTILAEQGEKLFGAQISGLQE